MFVSGLAVEYIVKLTHISSMIIKLIVDKVNLNVNLEPTKRYKFFPIYTSLSRNNVNIVKLLLNNGALIEKKWEKIALDLVKDNFNDYINILEFFIKLVNNDKKFRLIINSDRLSLGTDKKPVTKVYSKLSNLN